MRQLGDDRAYDRGHAAQRTRAALLAPVEHDAARPQQLSGGLQRRLRVRHEVQHMHEEHGVEAPPTERRPCRFAEQHRQPGAARAELGQHRRGDVDTDDVDAAARERDGDAAGADADLQEPGRQRRGAQRPHQPRRDASVRRIWHGTGRVVAVGDPVEALALGARHAGNGAKRR